MLQHERGDPSGCTLGALPLGQVGKAPETGCQKLLVNVGRIGFKASPLVKLRLRMESSLFQI